MYSIPLQNAHHFLEMSCISYLSLGLKVRLTDYEGPIHLKFSLLQSSLSIIHLDGEKINKSHLSQLCVMKDLVSLAFNTFHSLLVQLHRMVMVMPISYP